MKASTLIVTASLLIMPIFISSCSSIAKLTGANIEKVPGVGALNLKQEELVKKYSSATICLLESQKLAFDALGMRGEAAHIEAQINNLKAHPNDSSALTSCLKSMPGTQKMIMTKSSELSNKEELKIEQWKQSCQKLNQGLIEEAKLVATSTDLAIKLTKMLKEADPVQKALIAAQYRPIVYFLTTLPKDYQLMQNASALQKEVNKKLDIKLPPMKAIPSALPKMPFSF